MRGADDDQKKEEKRNRSEKEHNDEGGFDSTRNTHTWPRREVRYPMMMNE